MCIENLIYLIAEGQVITVQSNAISLLCKPSEIHLKTTIFYLLPNQFTRQDRLREQQPLWWQQRA